MDPRVSVIVPAFNLARYLPAAIDSALAQESPGGPVEVIVIDDGSTDDTPAVLDAYRDRVTAIRQPNRGLVAAVDRGLQEARGEYIALLDADDEWPRERLRRHAAILDRRPLVGLVHGDMEMIDANGLTTHPSFFALKEIRPTDGRVLGRLLANNFVSGGASTFRASLLPAIHPIPEQAAYPDWWIAACIAAVAEIEFDPAIANRYRYHGANMGLDAGPEQVKLIYRRELPWRRWMLRHLVDDDSVSLSDVREALLIWDHAVSTAGVDGEISEQELLEIVEAAVRRRESWGLALPTSAPLIALESRSRLTIAWLDEVVARPELLVSYAEETAAEDDASLIVLVREGASLTELFSLVESDPRLSGEGCDITALPEPLTPPARALLAARACAWLGETAALAAPYAKLPQHAAGWRALGLRQRQPIAG